MRLRGLAVLAIGYILGAKAGRERYEQIAAGARRFASRMEAYGTGGSFDHDRPAGDHEPGPDRT